MAVQWEPHRPARWAEAVMRLGRPVQLVTWTASTVALGAVWAPRALPGWPLALAAVLVGGALLQGYVTHGLNDLYDWNSGTDRLNAGNYLGGSQALRQGLITVGELVRLVVVAGVAGLALLIWLASWRGAILGAMGLAALTSAVLYSLPPVRLCYRPLAGEWLGIFPPMVLGVLAAGWAMGERWSALLVAVAVIQGVICNASVMQHHVVDIDADWQATPQKRTSPAAWQRLYGRRGAEVPTAYAALAALMAAGAALTLSPRFWWSCLVAVLSGLVASGTRVDDARDRNARDWWLKALAVVHALGYGLMFWWGIG